MIVKDILYVEIGLFSQENCQKWCKKGPQKGQFAIFSLVPLLLGPKNWSLGLKFNIERAGTFINVSYICIGSIKTKTHPAQ